MNYPITQPGVETKSISGYPLYRVASDGSVWSFSKGRKWRQLKAGTTKSGHQVVVLVNDGKPKSHNVHRLVIEAFIGPCPAGCECLHLNGDPKDNRIENLRWGTRKENCADTIRHGRTTFGERNPRAKLKSEQVAEIKRDLLNNVNIDELGRRFGVSKGAIASIKYGANWRSVPCS